MILSRYSFRPRGCYLAVKRSAILLSLCTLGCACADLAQTSTNSHPLSAADILASVRRATGGGAWDQFAECESEGTITIAGKVGTLHYGKDLRTGANVSRTDIPTLGVHQAHGVAPNSIWQQDDAGDIQLVPIGEPWQIVDLYLASHGYWRPNFGGASVRALDLRSSRARLTIVWRFRFPADTVSRSGSTSPLIRSNASSVTQRNISATTVG